MIKKIITITIKLLLICFLVIDEAYSQGDFQNLNLQNLIQQALETNHNAKKAHLDVKNSNYKIKEIRSATLPQISGTSAINYNPLLQQSALPGDFFGQPGTTILVALGQKWNASAGINVNQMIFNQAVFTGLKAASTTREFYVLNSDLTEENIIEQVTSAYYGIMVQRQQLVVLDTTINNTEKILAILQTNYQNGLVKKIDIDRISVTLSNLKTKKQQVVNSISLSENQLKFLVGIPIEQYVTLAEIDITEIKLHPVNDSITDFSNRLEIKMLETQSRLLKYQLKSFQAEYYPTLSLSGNYSYQGLGNEFPIGAQKNEANWFEVATIGLNLRVPLFNGFATNSRIQQSKIAIEKMDEDISLTMESMNLAYKNAITQLSNNLLNLSAQKENVQLAEDVYYNTAQNYNTGLTSLTDLLSAENSLIEAQNNYLTELLRYKLAELQVLKSRGQLKSLVR
jgi:outer membrane protein TolC